MNTTIFSCTYIAQNGKKRKVSEDGKLVMTDQFLTLVSARCKIYTIYMVVRSL